MLMQVSPDAVSCERLEAAFKPCAFSGSFDFAPMNLGVHEDFTRFAQDDRE
jgi:hypothetical protein